MKTSRKIASISSRSSHKEKHHERPSHFRTTTYQGTGAQRPKEGTMKIFLLIIIILLTGCSINPKGEWKWVHQSPSANFQKDHMECTIESNKIFIPSPSCTSVHNPWCKTEYCQTTVMSCDYSSKNIAIGQRNETYRMCMNLRHWEKKFFPYKQHPKISQCGILAGGIFCP